MRIPPAFQLLLLVAVTTLGACASARPRPAVEVYAPIVAAGRARADSMLANVAGRRETAPTMPAAMPALAPTVAGAAGPNEIGLREVVLANLDSLAATALLQSLFPTGDPATTAHYVVLGRRSRVLLTGTTAQMAAAAAALTSADKPYEHILLEALVVQVDRESLRELAVAIDQAARGTVSGAALTLGDLTNPAAIFTSTLGANNAQTFRAAIQALESEQRARILARPFLSTQSGDSAGISIGRDRYIVTGSPTGLGNLSSQQVATGTILSLRPMVMPDSQVMVSVNVEQSDFIPTEGNEAVQVDRASASTRVRVRSGETIVIGGLTLDRMSRFSSGLPFLARIPLLGALFGQRGSAEDSREVIILITPWIWKPGTSLPGAR